MMKKTVVWMLVFGMLLMPTLAMAAEERVISGEDLTAIFGEDTATGSGQTVQLAVLTDTEMKETEGALWFSIATRAGLGATAGAVRYTVTNAGTSSWSWRNFGRSTIYGAVGGVVGWNKPSSAIFGTAFSSGGMRWGW